MKSIIILFTAFCLLACGRGIAPLHQASRNGDTAKIDKLLKSGADINQRSGKENDTALMFAVNRGHENVAAALLKNGADVNATNDYGQAALHTAVFSGHPNIVLLLIEHGADVNQPSRRGYPLHIAAGHASSNRVEIVKLLLENGAKVDVRAKNHSTPLHWTDEDKGAEVAKLLINHGANVNAVSKINETPLHWSARKEELAVMKVLINHGAIIDSKNYVGMTPLLVAAKKGKSRAVELLLDNGANVNARSKQTEGTALHFAAYNGHVNVAKVLVKYNADRSLTDKGGYTAAELAKQHDKTSVIELLEKR